MGKTRLEAQRAGPLCAARLMAHWGWIKRSRCQILLPEGYIIFQAHIGSTKLTLCRAAVER